MLLPIRDLLLLIVTAVLLALSHATVKSSREDGVAFASYQDYLFRGRNAIHSLSGNLGAVFSLTGFVGATWVYALVFGGWAIIVIIAVIIFLMLATTAAVRRIDAEGVASGNIMLDYLQRHLLGKHFKGIVTIYSIVYFVLLVEELAAARLILREMVTEPVVMSFLLVLTAFTIYSYVHLGGFRAVVTADAVQIVVLLAFCGVLAGAILTVPGSSWEGLRFPTLTVESAAGLAGAIVFGIGWFAAALDFYARLNFNGRHDNVRTRRFIRLSWTLTAILLLLGAVFGTAMSGRITVDAKNTYPEGAVSFFLNGSPLVGLLFIAAIFSMMFTTLDTLMMTIIQVGYYQERRWFRRETLPIIVLLATFASTRMNFAATSSVGIFTGSLLILPGLAIARCFWPRLLAWLPDSTTYLLVAGGIAVAVFGLYYRQISTEFGQHFLLSLLMLGTAVTLGIGVTLAGWMKGAFRG